MALAATSGQGASLPQVMGSQKRDSTCGKEQVANGNCTGVVQQSSGEHPGRLAAPCSGVSAPSPMGCMDRQMVSSLHMLLSSVKKPLRKEEIF